MTTQEVEIKLPEQPMLPLEWDEDTEDLLFPDWDYWTELADDARMGK